MVSCLSGRYLLRRTWFNDSVMLFVSEKFANVNVPTTIIKEISYDQASSSYES